MIELEKSQKRFDDERYRHRAILVLDNSGNVVGKLSQLDVLKALEPRYVIGTMQAMFLIRPAKEAFRDFMDPSVLFIFASLTIGMVFTKTGLTKRLAYRMLIVVGERTSMIYLGCFIVTTRPPSS